MNGTIVPAAGNAGGGASYVVVDPPPVSDADDARAYLLEDIDLRGVSTLHGPVFLGDAASVRGPSSVARWEAFE